MNNAVKTSLTSEKIIERIKRKVIKENPTAYHIVVKDFTLYKKERYGFINTYAKAEVVFSTDSHSEEQICVVDFGIE